MAYNPLYKLQDNITATRIALDGGKPGPNEFASLERYSGFGGIKAILYPHGSIEDWHQLGATAADLKLYEPIQELHRFLKERFDENEYKGILQSLKNSVLTAFYTPSIVPRTLYECLRDCAVDVKSIYEPSAGAGAFIKDASNYFNGLEKIIAVEKDLLTGRVLSSIASGLPIPTEVKICGLEDTRNDGGHDLIVSNIPFGNFPVDDPDLPSAVTGKIHNYFFAKGLDKIRDGGVLAYITTDGFLNSPSNSRSREYLFNNANFVALAANLTGR